jgi:GxxExxY protein
MLLAEPLTDRVIGLAIEVHPRVKPGDHTGPGLLESVYELCLCRELADAGIAFARQVTIPVLYKGAEVGDGFKADIVVAGELILEIKAVSTILPIHAVQLRTGPRWPGLTRPCA